MVSGAICHKLLKVFFEELQVIAPHDLVGNLPDFGLGFTGKYTFGSCHLNKFFNHGVIKCRKFVSFFKGFYGCNHAIKIGTYTDVIPYPGRLPGN